MSLSLHVSPRKNYHQTTSTEGKGRVKSVMNHFGSANILLTEELCSASSREVELAVKLEEVGSSHSLTCDN